MRTTVCPTWKKLESDDEDQEKKINRAPYFGVRDDGIIDMHNINNDSTLCFFQMRSSGLTSRQDRLCLYAT
jgi:hypothetical protein